MQGVVADPRDARAEAFVRRVGVWSRWLGLLGAASLGASWFLAPRPAPGTPSFLPFLAVWVALANGTALRNWSPREPRAVAGLAWGVLASGVVVATAVAAAGPLPPIALAAIAIAGAAGLAQGVALWRIRRTVRATVVDELDRVSPAGAIPFAPLLPDVGRMCDAAGLLGIPWIIFGLLVVAFDGVAGPGSRYPNAVLAFVAGCSGVAGGVWMLALRGTVARGLAGDVGALRRGLISQIPASLVAGGPLYWHALGGGLAGDPVARAAWCLVPLVLPALFGLVLVFFGRAFAMRAELRRLESEWSRTLETGPATAEAALRAQANALRHELGMQELRAPDPSFVRPASARAPR